MRDLPDVINWRRISDEITTSGQPSETQLSEIQALGVTHILNLGPHHNTGALDDEASSVAALGMEYVYIPVEFESPTDEDFAKFCAAVERLQHTQIHVHCIYNARVSAFFYRYSKTGRTISQTEAHAMMDGIWRPGHDWAGFVGMPDARNQPNRYAGDDY
ncbi:MAG: protein tyrosine phosphatase family protein [Sedimentitalea sp.]